MKPEELRWKGDPYWIDVKKAGEFLHLPDKTILHAGPPIEYHRMCRGHQRSMVNACFFEGWASTEAEAVRLLESGEVKVEAAFDYATNGSGYGIITKSVPLLIIEDRETGGVAGLFPAEGKFGGGFCGWGIYSADIAANLRWLGEELFPPLVQVLQEAGGFPMRDLFHEAIRRGDELHSSQKALDPLFIQAITPYVLKCPNRDALMDYFTTTARFTHNFGQAASRALLLGLEKQGIKGLMTAAGGNGVEYGIKVDGVWHVAPAPMIIGPYLTPGAKKENQLPWMGDSSVVECRGWGGTIRPINPDFGVKGKGLVINGGMMDVNGGWMGAGSTRMPDFDKRPGFEEVLPGTFLLKIPFGPVWTGIILIKGEKNILIDSSHLEPEQYLIPALEDLGMKPGDIDWLLNTHVHGDHIGGHYSLVTKYGLKTATLSGSADALRDPVKVAIRVRTRFPKNSPSPQLYLKGVEPDRLLEERELLEGRFYALATPGHDDDCLIWVDTRTGTAFTGDSLQGNGTATQGIGFYRDLNAYRSSLDKMAAAGFENIVCGHDYDGIGCVIKGAAAVSRAIQYSIDRVSLYDNKIKSYIASGIPIEDEPVALALKLIGEVGCGMPAHLFLALHTVSEHLK